MIPKQQLLFLHQSFGLIRAYSRELKQERKKIEVTSLLKKQVYLEQFYLY